MSTLTGIGQTQHLIARNPRPSFKKCKFLDFTGSNGTKEQARHFLDTVRCGTALQPPAADLDEAVKTMRLADAIMAGLKGIPTVYREAAIVDGAGPWQIMWNITLPLLKRVLMFVVVTQTIFSFQNFVPVYVMTKGGPIDSTKVIVYYIYQFGFLFQDMGYASAMSIVTLLILLVVSVIQMRLFRSDVEY